MKTFPLQSLTIIEAQQKQFTLVDSICRHFPGAEFLTSGDLGLTPGLNQPRITQRVEQVLADAFHAPAAALVQGALIATLMNAIALIASQTWHEHPVDLLLSLLAQSLTGLLLGAGIQRLRELNQSLQNELVRNQRLAERLLETEESVRREVARELHDDIGQTITAIRTQAGIVQRLAPNSASVRQSGQLIEQLSLGVYDSVRRLLGRLRPRQLDDLTLEQAVRSLMREMELEDRGMVSHLEWRIDESLLSENQRVTLFRVCQEGLNNIVKHASASAVTLHGWQQEQRLMLVLEDDGCGLPPGSGQQGFGLTGMRERVSALGGTLTISCTHGTRVCVSLPLRYA